MDCTEIEAALVRGEVPRGPGLDAHLAGCASCRFLVGDAGLAQALAGPGAEPAPADLEALRTATLGGIDRERGPLAWLRARSRPGRAAVVVAAMALAIGVYLHLYHLRGDLDVYPAARLAATLGAFVLLALILSWEALRPLWLPPAQARLLVAVGLAAPIVLALLPEEPTLPRLPNSATYYAVKCFLLGAAQAAAVLVAARVLARGRSGLLLAAAGAGLAGIAGVILHCPINAPSHLLAGHATVPIAFVLLAALGARLAPAT